MIRATKENKPCRLYSQITIKSINEEQRIIEGIASTPSTDRMGDIVEPMGAEFNLPLPLLWQHDSRQPIGEVTWAKPNKDGIPFKAQIANVPEPGTLKDRLDEAWQSLKYKLVKGVSIGFSEIETASIKDTWSYHFLKWNWLELSCVTIPANADASITSIKSADEKQLAAIGREPRLPVSLSKTIPGATGQGTSLNPPKGTEVKQTIKEQIAAFEAKRAASVEESNTIMTKAADEGRTLNDEEKTKYDTLKSEIKDIEEHLVRLKDHEARNIASAAPVVGTDPAAASTSRAGTGASQERSVIAVRRNLPEGIGFTRYVTALARSKGNLSDALAIAENNPAWKNTPEVAVVLKAAVAGGDTTSAGWATELVYNQNLVAEFIEFLRPQTVLGRIPGITKVPFNVRMSGADQGSSANWVGQGKPVPVSKMHTIAVTLGIAKAAGLVVLTNELVRSSDPSAELLVRNDLAKAIQQFLDQQFLSPDYAAVANVSPASMTSGVIPVPASGTTSAALRTDVQTLFAAWIAANLDPSKGVWIMTPTTALAISLMLNALGQPVFPGITMNGGEFFGLPVVTSNSATMVGSPVSGEGNMIILLNAPEVLLADDGQVTIDASAEASLEMLDNPTNSAAAGTPTTMVSMFQTNSIAIRAVRFINWAKRRSVAVQYIKDAAYVT